MASPGCCGRADHAAGAEALQGGFVDEVCLVWDSEDRLVAQGTQFAGIRFQRRRDGGDVGAGNADIDDSEFAAIKHSSVTNDQIH